MPRFNDDAVPYGVSTAAVEPAMQQSGSPNPSSASGSGRPSGLFSDSQALGNTIPPRTHTSGNSMDGVIGKGNDDISRQGASWDASTNDPTASRYKEPKNPVRRFFNRIVPHGGFLSNSYNLASVTLGSGIIALPSAFNQTGIFLAVVVLLWITISTVYSIYLLMLTVEKTNLRCYEAMSRKLLGRGWDYFAAFIMWIFCFGSCVSYVISIGDLLTPALQPTDAAGNIIRLESLPPFLQTKAGNRCLTSLVWLCVMLPLSLPKEINSLRYASVVGVTCMMYFVICIIVHSVRGFEGGQSRHELAAFRTGNDVIMGFSLFLFAYLCQTNCFEVYREMSKPSPLRLCVQTAASMSVCTLLYLMAGIFGYADFGSAITDSILLYYNVREDVMVAIAYFGIGFKLCVGFAICMQPTRDAVYYCIRWNLVSIPWWKNSLVCGFMAVVALILGLFIPSVTIVFSLTGGLCGGFLGFIFPALYVMYSGNWGLKQVGWFHYISTYALLLSGVIAVVFGTVAAIFDAAS